MSTRNDGSFLRDVLVAADKIQRITADISKEGFSADEIRQAAILHHLTVIGEAINRLSPGLKQRWSGIPWHQIVSIRHRIVHAYFDLDWTILWIAATEEIPELRKQVEAIVQTEFPPDFGSL